MLKFLGFLATFGNQSTHGLNQDKEQQQKEKEMIAQAMGQAIRELREEKDLSQYKVSRLADIDPVVFQRYDTGKVAPGMVNLLKIAKGIGIHPAQILEKVMEYLQANPDYND